MNILLDATPAVANVAEATGIGSGNLYSDILIVVLIIVMVALLLAALMVNNAMKSILKITMPEVVKEEAEKKKVKGSWWKRSWKKISGIRPIEEEDDLVIDHSYDGIQELDNPVPIWFNTLFYGTIFFGLLYLLNYHVFGWGMNQDQEYKVEMAKAEKERQEFLAQSASNVDENSVVFEEGLVGEGKTIFMANCVACHGEHGEGGIGPNLTDNYWLHGGDIKQIFHTVKYGVPDKGMVPWEQTLTPAQIASVSSYIVTLHDTHPANAKEPQGEEMKETSGAEKADAAAPKDSVQTK